jgi:hypothetical protein
MKPPVGARPDSFAILFVYEKAGKQYEFTATELPADLDTYKFISRKDKLVRKGNAEPAIKGFSLSGDSNIDTTADLLAQPYSVILFVENFSVRVSSWEQDFLPVYRAALAKNIPVYLVTSDPGIAKKELAGKEFRDISIYKCDFTAIRTAARANPTLYILKQGTIVGKWSKHGFTVAEKTLEKFDKQTMVNLNQ